MVRIKYKKWSSKYLCNVFQPRFCQLEAMDLRTAFRGNSKRCKGIRLCGEVLLCGEISLSGEVSLVDGDALR